jgi:Putative zinc-finger
MTEVPKIVPKIVPAIVSDRLQAALPQSVSGQAHPDADLLTAFVELVISAPERDSVLQHLASCGDCRDVVALALPAIEIVNVSIAPETDHHFVGAQARAAKSGRNWLSSFTFAAPTLRWAAMAAGVAVVASVLLMRPGKLNQSNQGNSLAANQQIAAATPSASVGRIVPSPRTSPDSKPPAVLAKAETSSSPELQTSKKFDSRSAAKSVTHADPEVLMADNRIVSDAKDLDRAMRDRGTNKSAPTSLNGPLRAGSDVQAIEKAKPASPANLSDSPATDAPSANGASAADLSRADLARATSAIFAIAGGILQRSLDNGQSWQNALHADHSLLCYASRDRDIWTGGEAGALFHSADNGVTWVRVQASVGAQMLTSDILHIDLSGSDGSSSISGGQRTKLVVSTRNQEVWSSANGGTTWVKTTGDKN